MNPNLRTNWKEVFSDFRAWISSIPAAHHEHVLTCPDCGERIFLVRGRHSGKFFYSHEGLTDCRTGEGRFFNTREEAQL